MTEINYTIYILNLLIFISSVYTYDLIINIIFNNYKYVFHNIIILIVNIISIFI